MVSLNNLRHTAYTQNVTKTGGATLGSFPCTKTPKDPFINMDTNIRLPQCGSACFLSKYFKKPSVAYLHTKTLDRLAVTN